MQIWIVIIDLKGLIILKKSLRLCSCRATDPR